MAEFLDPILHVRTLTVYIPDLLRVHCGIGHKHSITITGQIIEQSALSLGAFLNALPDNDHPTLDLPIQGLVGHLTDLYARSEQTPLRHSPYVRAYPRIHLCHYDVEKLQSFQCIHDGVPEKPRVQAYQGAKNSPSATWTSRPFKVAASDGWFNVDVMVPAPEPEAARPDGAQVTLVVSGTTDEWYDEVTGRWLRAKEAIDPYGSWARVPNGARWIWRAGRTSAEEERHGATVEFRRRFSIDRPASTRGKGTGGRKGRK